MTRELEHVIAEAKRSLCAQSYYHFVKEAFAVIDPATPFVDNWHIRYLCDVLQAEVERIAEGRPKEHDLIINIPPRSLKSTIATIAIAPWAWVRFPHLRFLTSSYAASLSIEHSVKARRIIDSEWYQRNWGHLVRFQDDQNQKSYYENIHGGSRQSVSVGGAVMGKGAHIIIIDDPQDPKAANSEVSRKTSIEHFTSDLSTRLDNPSTGMFIVVQQRLHEVDLTGYLIKNEPGRWQHICLPARLNDRLRPESLKPRYADGLLFPARFTHEFLQLQKERLGSREAAGQYDQSPRKQEGNIIKDKWFFRYRRADLPATYQVDFYCDTAYTDDTENDPSVIMAYTTYGGRLFILGISVVRKEFPEFCRHLLEYCAAMGAGDRSRIYVEPKASGKSVVQQLKRLEGLNIVEDEPPSTSKVERANAITPRLEAGKVGLPFDDDELGGTWVGDFLQECTNFPNAEHDDQVDCLTGSVRKGLRSKVWDHI